MYLLAMNLYMVNFAESWHEMWLIHFDFTSVLIAAWHSFTLFLVGSQLNSVPLLIRIFISFAQNSKSTPLFQFS
jgi:hypothetical protein